MLGFYLLIDGYDATNRKMLFDRICLLRWMDALPDHIRMDVLSPAVVKRVELPRCPEGFVGLNGFLFTYGGHVSVHTFPFFNQVHLGIFSTKELDVEKILGIFVGAFGIKKMEHRVIECVAYDPDAQAIPGETA